MCEGIFRTRGIEHRLALCEHVKCRKLIQEHRNLYDNTDSIIKTFSGMSSDNDESSASESDECDRIVKLQYLVIE